MVNLKSEYDQLSLNLKRYNRCQEVIGAWPNILTFSSSRSTLKSINAV